MKNFKTILILISLLFLTACSSVKTVPKYVLSMDHFDFSQDGIIHKNIIDFLLEDEGIKWEILKLK